MRFDGVLVSVRSALPSIQSPFNIIREMLLELTSVFGLEMWLKQPFKHVVNVFSVFGLLSAIDAYSGLARTWQTDPFSNSPQLLMRPGLVAAKSEAREGREAQE